MDFVEQLKQQIDIVRVVGEYVRLKRAGAGPRWVGLCPFHTEKTPSFGVHAVHQYYKCFGCGAGGDMLKFVMEIEGITFYEALKLLSERYGIPMPQRREYADPEAKARAALYEMHELAAKHYRATLESSQGAEARAYLERRGLNRDLAESFGLGLSERSGQGLVRVLSKGGFGPEQMLASGLVRARSDGSGSYDYFRGRLMYPIQTESGKIIAFAGRALAEGDEPKYLNSPETPIYRKSFVLYNLHRARKAAQKSSRVVLVEGYMDVIGVWRAGVEEVVASCGTSLTPQQVRIMHRHAPQVVVNFDPDAAGAAATERSIEILLAEHLQVRVLQLAGGLDQDEYVKQNGAEAYKEALARAGGYFHWLADRARLRHDVKTTEGRVAAFQFLLPAVHRLPDRIERAAVAGDLASYLGVEPGLLLDQFRRAAAERKEAEVQFAAPNLPVIERLLLRSLIASQEARERVLPGLEETGGTERLQTRKIMETLIAMHRSGHEFRYTEFAARLEEADRNLMTSLLFADEEVEEQQHVEQAEACLARIEADAREAQIADLKNRIRIVERSGDLGEALRLTTELVAMEETARRSREP